MGLFKKRAADPTEIDHLKSELAAMGARLEAADRRLVETAQRLDASDSARGELSELGDQVRGIVRRLETPLAPPPDVPPPAPIDPEELHAVTRRLDELAARLDTVDIRITSIANELAHQIDELSGEIEASSATPPADDVVAELRDAQTRLANEQARYQIAFRQDLAQLAERLRRS